MKQLVMGAVLAALGLSSVPAIAADSVAPAFLPPVCRPFVLLDLHATGNNHARPPLVQHTSRPVYKCLGFDDGFANAGRRLGGTDTDAGRHQEPRDADISETGLSGPEGDPNIIEVYIARLRNKLDRPFNRKTLHTVRGVGYRISSGDE